MRIVRIVLIALSVYVLLGTGLAGALAYLQPDRGANTIVLTTLDARGKSHETKLRVRDVEGQQWLVSGQWFRSWYNRAVAHPEVTVRRAGILTTYLAVPVNDETAVEMVLREDRESAGAVGMLLGHALLLFAPPKLLRLDPIPEAVSG